MRAVDPHSFFADPDPTVFLDADPDPAACLMRFRIQLSKICKNFLMKSFLEFKKAKRYLKSKKP